MRDDFSTEQDDLRDFFSYSYYDEAADIVECRLIAKTDYERFFQSQAKKERLHAYA